MFNLGIAKCSKRYIKQYESCLKAKGVNLKDLGMVVIALEVSKTGTRNPRYFVCAYSLGGHLLMKIPRQEVFPDGWEIKKPLVKRLSEW